MALQCLHETHKAKCQRSQPRGGEEAAADEGGAGVSTRVCKLCLTPTLILNV